LWRSGRIAAVGEIDPLAGKIDLHRGSLSSRQPPISVTTITTHTPFRGVVVGGDGGEAGRAFLLS
jgi:hypothetical protein